MVTIKQTFLILYLSISAFLTACTSSTPLDQNHVLNPPSKKLKLMTERKTPTQTTNDEELIRKYQNQKPKQWGERVTGVKRRLVTNKKVIALTLDACGGPAGSKSDAKLIEYLQSQRIPATLFVNYRWINANLHLFQTLAKNPLFEIENHGTKHLPLSVNGRSIYGIRGTQNIKEIIEEVRTNNQRIEELTGKKPKFFRSGTAYYDEVAVQIAQELGNEVVNFDIVGDAGATFSKQQVKQSLLQSKSGSIVLIHMNKPKSDTAEGMIEAIPLLQKRGFHFVQLKDQPLH